MKAKLFFIIIIYVFSIGFAKKVAEFPNIIRAKRILINDNKLIVSQKQKYSVHVYSLSDYTLIAKFAKRGEGPGEVKRTPYIFSSNNSILLYSWGKLIWYSVDGRINNEIRLNNERLIAVRPLKTNYSGCIDIFNPKDFSHILNFYLLDKKVKIKKKLYSGQRDANSADSKGFRQFKMINHYLASQTYSDKIFICDSRKGFYFEVFDSNGARLYIIDKKYNKIKIGEDFKKIVIDDLKLQERELWPMVKNVIHFYC